MDTLFHFLLPLLHCGITLTIAVYVYLTAADAAENNSLLSVVQNLWQALGKHSARRTMSGRKTPLKMCQHENMPPHSAPPQLECERVSCSCSVFICMDGVMMITCYCCHYFTMPSSFCLEMARRWKKMQFHKISKYLLFGAGLKKSIQHLYQQQQL